MREKEGDGMRRIDGGRVEEEEGGVEEVTLHLSPHHLHLSCSLEMSLPCGENDGHVMGGWRR